MYSQDVAHCGGPMKHEKIRLTRWEESFKQWWCRQIIEVWPGLPISPWARMPWEVESRPNFLFVVQKLFRHRRQHLSLK
jgi:hypothetical protein